jgi:hypothetical protein
LARERADINLINLTPLHNQNLHILHKEIELNLNKVENLLNQGITSILQIADYYQIPPIPKEVLEHFSIPSLPPI